MAEDSRSPETITVDLTRGEATALLYGYEINEFPVSNPLGPFGEALLDSAETKLKLALGTGELVVEEIAE